jgi:beta-glucanase (GH16 family)
VGIYDGPGHAGNGCRCPAQVTEGDGALTITGLPNGDSGGMAWKNGQTYGRWEVRMRVTQDDTGGHAYHPVLILWPDSDNWPDGGELDYAETDAGSPKIEAFLHYGDGTPDGAQEAFSHDVDLTQWHNYAIEWTSGHIVGYLDGQEWFSTTDNFVQPPGPMHQTIQLDDFFPNGGLNRAQMQADWVRTYNV